MATLKIHNEKKKERKKHILSKKSKTQEKINHFENLEKGEAIKNLPLGNAGMGWLKIIFSSFNFLISLILTLLILGVYFQKPLIQSMLGSQFSLDVTNIIVLGILFLLYSIFEQFNAIYYLKRSIKGTKITAFLKFLISVIMIFTILYLIFKHGIQWFGASLFGNTSLGKNEVFYIPSIIYLTYSIFLSLLSYYDILN
ncbi:hypothetical protein SAMN02745164_00059 [Marinitoga hydrogenitolerans DSM 16785]|uniref:Uncharacterized protein n=1 Tax=Marinitoga hydrogenitolerans (strain DSM 16785 / JCM 12826 / AT1271) TaxID=1122195 RepID=A0A1M4S5Q8_MARH1|nr:hypothetical protein [Marinitoga hydrogenitolerans]SHE27536.1 hypothetical protein SAMN02745164_00059 [Marinitoga hydrogenitolerans DSM 16785]